MIGTPGDPEALEETLDILSDPLAVTAIRRGQDEVDCGDYVAPEELRAKYLRR